MQHYETIRELIDRVRARWRALCAMRAFVRGALIAAAVLGLAVLASRWTIGAPVVLMLVAAAAVLTAVAALTWCLAPLRHVPADGKVARFIEERAPSLDDRLVTAVDVAHSAAARRARGDRCWPTPRGGPPTSTSTRLSPAESLRRAGSRRPRRCSRSRRRCSSRAVRRSRPPTPRR